MNSKITEIKNPLERTNSRISEAEWTGELEERMGEITTEKQNKGKGMKRIEDSLRDFQDNSPNICTNI